MPQCAVLRVKLRGCDQLLAQGGGGIDQEPVLAVGADRDRGLRASAFRMLAARLPAHFATAIPLRYAAAGGCAQDGDAKHDPSPDETETGQQIPRRWTPVRHAPDQGMSPEVHLRRIREVLLAAYLRVALTNMLISMQHGTSTIFGAFQAILDLLETGRPFRPCY